MSQGADSLGYSIVEIKKIGNQLLLSEDSAVPGFSEDLFAYMNGTSLLPDSTLVVGRLSGLPLECKVWRNGNHVNGYANFPKRPNTPALRIDQKLPDGTLFRAQSLFMSPFYQDLSIGKSWSYDQFSSMDGKLRKITAKAVSIENITLNGQTYEALRLELSGGVANQNLFIDTDKPRILKITFKDTPWIYELIESKSK